MCGIEYYKSTVENLNWCVGIQYLSTIELLGS